MNFLPININIEGKRILIVGGGKVGLHKATILSRFTDEATVVSPKFREGFDRLPFTLVRKEYEPSDLDGAALVYICTENHALNRQIREDAAQRHVLASVCDSPELCDFTSPAIYKQGDMTISVASNATDVRKSIRIRDEIREHYSSPVLLSTCHRNELYWGDGDITRQTARHLFRVAAGLESPILGETAILSQVKRAYEEARQQQRLSPMLNRLFQTALHVGHRVRTETAISRGAVSYSQVTVDMLCRLMPDLGNRVVSIIGVNDMTESIINFLTARGATNVILANRSMDKAREMAARHGAVAMPLAEKRRLLSLSDVVITATSAPHTLIGRSDFEPSDKRQLLFDLARPADIEEDVRWLIGKRLFTLDDIIARARQNIRRRERDIERCEAIIEEEIDGLMRWQEYRRVARN